MKRRLLLKGSLAGAGACALAGTGLLIPRAVLAVWNTAAFSAETVGAALQDGLGSDTLTQSAEVRIEAPDNPQNGAAVPVEVATSLTGVQSIALLVEKNTRPLCGIFHLGKRTQPRISIRVKVGEPSEIIAVARAGDTLYSARKAVKVTVGGCD
jgi:sulfur-oxidizing protein SoxY